MKIGVRKPNFKKRIKARTTGKLKRKVKKATNPLYGKKGMGFVKNPKRAIYNKTYNKTTVDLFKTSKNSIWFWIFVGIWWYPLKWMCILIYLGIKKLVIYCKSKMNN